MSRPPEKFVVYNLRETYHELGRYEFKIVLNPKLFKNSHFSNLSIIDSDGRPMTFETEYWGRKINCSFLIDESVADGVSLVKLDLRRDEGGDSIPGRLTFWVIKP